MAILLFLQAKAPLLQALRLVIPVAPPPLAPPALSQFPFPSYKFLLAFVFQA